MIRLLYAQGRLNRWLNSVGMPIVLLLPSVVLKHLAVLLLVRAALLQIVLLAMGFSGVLSVTQSHRSVIVDAWSS